MLINKDLNLIMRIKGIRNIREENDSGIIAGACGIIALAIIAGCLICGCDDHAWAAQINDKDAINAIIGEAENQDYTGMLAVACAIRNRNTLAGVYGLNAYRVKNKLFSKNIYQQATRAWDESNEHDITNGATNWENINQFGSPYWEKDMIEVFRYRDHIFFKQKGF